MTRILVLVMLMILVSSLVTVADFSASCELAQIARRVLMVVLLGFET